jgi:hypothetical protein
MRSCESAAKSGFEMKEQISCHEPEQYNGSPKNYVPRAVQVEAMNVMHKICHDILL